jgi:hypothetical protein
MKKEVATLEAMSVGQLRERYIEDFGEPVRSRHKKYLIRRIAWRLRPTLRAACRSGRCDEPRNWPTRQMSALRRRKRSNQSTERRGPYRSE